MDLRPTLTKSTLRSHLSFAALVLTLKLLLSFMLILMSDEYAYYGMVYNPRPMVEQLLTFFALGMVALTTEIQLRKVSTGLHFAIFIACLIPISVEYDMNIDRNPAHFWPLLLLFLFVPIIRNYLPSRKESVKRALNFKQYFYLLSILIFILLGLVIVYYGFKFNLGGLDALYDQRSSYKEESNRLSEYAFNWLVYVLNPALLVYSFWKGKPILTILSLAFGVYFFSLGGHKAALLVIPMGIAVYSVYRLTGNRILLWLTGGLVVMVGVLLLVDLTTGQTSLPSSILLRRGLILPAQIYFNYAEFFTANPLNVFSHNIPFSFFLSSPYAEKLPIVIGQEYYSYIDNVHANGNIFADSFANVGFWSFPLLLIVLPIIYGLLDAVSKAKPMQYVLPMVLIASVTFINSGLIVSLVTHGFLLLLLILLLIPIPLFQIRTLKP